VATSSRRVNSAPRLRPCDGLGPTGVDSLEPGPDLGGPRGLRVGVDVGLETLNQLASESGPFLIGKPKRLDEQLSGVHDQDYHVIPDCVVRSGYQGLGGELRYWRTPAGSEDDFVWTRAGRAVGIEVKASTSWRSEFGAPLKSLMADRIVQSGFGVYTGDAELKDGPLRVLPWRTFLRQLAAGHILG